MKFERENHPSICYNGNVVVIGGLNNECEEFNTTTKEWTHFAETVQARAGATAVAHSQSIFLFGGYNNFTNQHYTSIECYSNSTWTLLPQDFVIPMTLVNSGGISLNNAKIMLFGGFSAGNEEFNQAVIMDTQAKTSKVEGTMPFHRYS